MLWAHVMQLQSLVLAVCLVLLAVFCLDLIAIIIVVLEILD